MDLSRYINKSAAKNKYNISAMDRKCRQCGRTLEDKGHFLYARGFCSEECNSKYIK